MAKKPGAASLWRDRNYLCYRICRLTSTFGSGMSSLAYPLLVLSIGGGVVLAGAVGTSSAVGGIVFQLHSGYFADRFNTRRLMLGMDALRVVTVGSIPLAAALHRLTVPHILMVSLIAGAASSIYASADTVFLRELVPSDMYPLAISQGQATSGATSLLSPVLGGALYGVDRMLPFIADASSFAVGGVLLLAVSARGRRADADAGASTDRRITAGIRWLLRRHDFMRMLLFCAVINVVGIAAGVAAILIMNRHGTPPSVIGIVMACDGLAVIIGALIARWIAALGLVRVFLACGVIWVCCLAAMAAAPSSPWAIGTAVVAMSAIVPSTGVIWYKMLNEIVPSDMYGRVTSAQRLFATSLMMLGPLLAGVLVAAVAPAVLWLMLAGICLLMSVVTITPLLTLPAQATALAGRGQ